MNWKEKSVLCIILRGARLLFAVLVMLLRRLIILIPRLVCRLINLGVHARPLTLGSLALCKLLNLRRESVEGL